MSGVMESGGNGRAPLLGVVVMVVAASLFGTLGLLSHSVYDLGLTPFAFVAWRAGIGAIVVALIVAWRVTRGGRRLVTFGELAPRERLALTVAAAMGATLNLAMFLAFERTSVAVVLLCFYLYPALVAAASALLGWEALDRGRAVALVLALGGMVAVVAGGSTAAGLGSIDLLGVALALSAAGSQTVFVLVSRGGYRRVPTDQAMLVVLVVAAVSAAVLAVVGGRGDALLAPLGQGALLAVLGFAGVFAAAIPSLLFLAGIRWLGPVRAGVLMLVEPLVGVTLAALFLAEAIGPIQFAGGTAILFGAALAQRAAARAHPPSIVITAPADPVDAGAIVE